MSERLPYPGLRTFTREESDLFFGRDGCVDAMVDRLAATRFLTVLGPSGSGKSSLVRTGLLDALDLGLHPWAGSRWRVADFHPGDRPMRNLAQALLATKQGADPDASDVDLLAAFLRRGPRSIVEWAAGGNLPADWNLLILVDQFEELFRYGDYAEREEAEAFVALLIDTAAAANIGLHVVLTMRSEYLGACSLLPGLAEEVNAGLYLTPRMSREECQEAIEGPAAVIGFAVEPALVNRLLNDLACFAPWERDGNARQSDLLARRADQLPLMQHVLNRLWKCTRDRQGPVELKLADYEEVGGLSGALDAHGAEVLDALGKNRLADVESIFRALMSGASAALAVRRPCRLSELVDIAGGRRQDVVDVVTAFAARDVNFLRVSETTNADDAIVDISHESLIRQWTPLRQWAEKEARDAAAWRRLLAAQQRHSISEGGLLTGLDYQSQAAWWESAKPAAVWARRHGGDYETIRTFLEESGKAEQAEREANLARDRRERMFLRIGMAVTTLLLIVVTILSWRLNNARQSAQNNATQATASVRSANANLRRATENEKHAVQSERETLHLLDDVTNVVYADDYRELVGVGAFQSELMEKLLPYLNTLYKRNPNGIGPEMIVQNEYRVGVSHARNGNAGEATRHYAQGYQTGLSTIRSIRKPNDALAATFIKDAYYYAWLLLDNGKTAEAESVRRNANAVAHRVSENSKSADLLLQLARLENLENRYLQDVGKPDLANQHLRHAVELSARAVALNPSMEALSVQCVLYNNQGGRAAGARQQQLYGKACALASRMMQKNPLDLRAIDGRISCLRNDASLATYRNDFATAADRLRAARALLDGVLQLYPREQNLLLTMSNIEIAIGDLESRRGDEAARNEHKQKAQSFFVQALKGRTLLQSRTDQVKSLYDGFAGVVGLDNKQEYRFYKDTLDVVEPTLAAYPDARSFGYVATNAALHLGELLSNDARRRNEATKYLTLAIDGFDKMLDPAALTSFSEDFANHCRAYRYRANVWAAAGDLDHMIADVDRMNEVCKQRLDKYPWDFFLRWNVIGMSLDAGVTLYEHHRYADALPRLKYASHWGISKATGMLATMYREGHGVPQNVQEAQRLEALASRQGTTRIDIPADFSGVKSPVAFYLHDWPQDFQFHGIDDQVRWLKEARGGTVAPEVMNRIKALQKTAWETNVSFAQFAQDEWSKQKP
jgi:hypothetical protein